MIHFQLNVYMVREDGKILSLPKCIIVGKIIELNSWQSCRILIAYTNVDPFLDTLFGSVCLNLLIPNCLFRGSFGISAIPSGSCPPGFSGKPSMGRATPLNLLGSHCWWHCRSHSCEVPRYGNFWENCWWGQCS